jgi:hypothetical protein
MTDCGASSESARVRTGSAVSSFEGCDAVRYVRSDLSTATTTTKRELLPYLCMAVHARRAGEVVHVGRPDVAEPVLVRGVALAGGVFLRVVFDLRVSVSAWLLSRAAASTSVATVPLLSTGEGSTVEG